MIRKPSRALRAVLWGLVGAIGLASAWFLVQPPSPQRSAQADIGQGDYRLVTHDGGTFTQASLPGQPSLVFFGFTHCPDVCPTTIGDILTWQTELGEAAGDLRVFFVTVDPARDTPEILADYISWLPGAAGVTGTQEEIHKAMRAFRILARKVPKRDGDYTVDHSSPVLVFGADGRFATNIPYQMPLDQALERLRTVLR